MKKHQYVRERLNSTSGPLEHQLTKIKQFPPSQFQGIIDKRGGAVSPDHEGVKSWAEECKIDKERFTGKRSGERLEEIKLISNSLLTSPERKPEFVEPLESI